MSTVELYDNGTQGDAKAGDGTYTVSGLDARSEQVMSFRASDTADHNAIFDLRAVR